MKNYLVILFIIVCYSSVFCQTQITVTFKPDSTIGQDAIIWTTGNCILDGNTQPNTYMNFGKDNTLCANTWTHNAQGCPTGTNRTLLKFDELSTIPTTATIIKAKLKLYGLPPGTVSIDNSCYPGSPYNSYCPNTSFIQQVTSAWNEQTVTWNTQPTTTTVNRITIPQTTYQWNWDFMDSSANLLAMVRDWVQNPATNYGFMMRLETEAHYRAIRFASSDHPNSALHPELTVVYIDCPADTTTFDAVICEGETYFENGFNESQSGTYIQKLKNQKDCDSLIILNLTVKSFDTITFYDTICTNNVYTKHGFTISADKLQTAGLFEFRDTIPNPIGCDTIVILNLYVMEKETSTLNAVICYGETYDFHGNLLTESDIYYDTLQNRFGCDSIVILNLTVKLQDTTEFPAEICDGGRYTQNGFNATKTGIYTQNLKNIHGCDSTVILYLTVNSTPDIEIIAITDNFCDKDSIILQIITNGDIFLWSTGSSENPLPVTKAGTYSATAFIENCSKTAHYTVEECPCAIWLPNAFSPNGDGLNDSFSPVVYSTLHSFSMHIYDRWGQLVFKTDTYLPWDGTIGGKSAAAGVYSYIISYSCAREPSKIHTKQGSITLVR